MTKISKCVCGAIPGIRVKEQTRGGYGLYEPATIYWVECPICGRRGGRGFAQYNGILGREVTRDEAAQIAVEKWNTGFDDRQAVRQSFS